MRRLAQQSLLTVIVLLTLMSVSNAEFYYEQDTIPLSGDPGMFIVEDLNNDSLDDIVVLNSTGVLSVILNTGTATLGTPVDYAGVADANSFCAGYFNNDAFLDIAVGINTTPREIKLYINNGDGTFQAPITSPGHDLATYSISGGDFNSDGLDDLALTGGFNHADSVEIFFNNGDGTFTYGYSIFTDRNPVQVIAADLNNDMDDDVVIMHRADLGFSPENNVWILIGNGDSTFQAPVYVDGPLSEFFVSVDDYENDGDLDLTISANDIDTPLGFVAIWLNDGTGISFTPVFSAGAVFNGLNDGVAEDINQDGLQDIICSYWDGIYININPNTEQMSDHSFYADTYIGFHNTANLTNNSCEEIITSGTKLIVFSHFSFSDCCCRGIRGNVDGDANDEITISDIVAFINIIFLCDFPPCEFTCVEEVDMDASGSIDIADVVFIVNYMFGGGPGTGSVWELSNNNLSKFQIWNGVGI